MSLSRIFESMTNMNADKIPFGVEFRGDSYSAWVSQPQYRKHFKTLDALPDFLQSQVVDRFPRSNYARWLKKNGVGG